MYLERAHPAFLTTLVVLVTIEVVPNTLTLFGTGLKIYIKFFFAFHIGHIEIGKGTKFGVI